SDPDSRSAGSFFKNPIVTMEQSEDIADEAEAALPCWPQPDGRVKLSAAWLIEHAGFQRGEKFGRVGLSSKHILALINKGGATAADVVDAALRVQDFV